MRLTVMLWILWFAAVAFAGPEESAVQVKHYAGGVIECGSGTVVKSAKGQGSDILTNWHVAHDAGERLEVIAGEKVYPAKWLKAHSGIDLALLHIDAELPAVALADQSPPPGVRLHQWGHPRGGPRTHKTGPSGRIDGKRAIPEGGDVMTNGIASEPGDSGCGVFTEDGRLVAVCWGSGGPGRESCVVLSDIKAFLGHK